MDAPPLAVTITLTRSTDWRSWIATYANDGTATGRGDTAGQAVEDLLRWPSMAQRSAGKPE